MIYAEPTPEAVMAVTGALRANLAGDYETFVRIIDAQTDPAAVMGALWEVAAFAITSAAEALDIPASEALNELCASFVGALIQERETDE